ncbi:MAG TPA: hypothetical protein VNI58_09675 [Mariprofundaceae bacterium]|nr:hypothetical protein [Mariprofundaceae bacterium]
MDVSKAIRQLEYALQEVRGDLVQSAGHQSVCSIHKHGSPSDFLKYSEGKEFIVRKVISLLNRQASEAELASFLSENEVKFNRYKSSELTSSSAWQAYADGGLDGIELTKRLLEIPGKLI